MDPTRSELVRKALRLSELTIVWNGAVGAAALVISALTGSLVLAGFALNALLDSSASGVLVWRFRKERADPEAGYRLERRAQAFIAGALLVVALYLGVRAGRALGSGSEARESAAGVLLAAVSLVALPWLGQAKLRVAVALPSRALRGDAMLTLAGATLAGLTLTALLLVSALDWWWADPAAALAVAAALALEAVRVALHHRFG